MPNSEYTEYLHRRALAARWLYCAACGDEPPAPGGLCDRCLYLREGATGKRVRVRLGKFAAVFTTRAD